ncbi:tetratricopeptide repeat protein [Roseibium sp.]|uniref:tetratricopeptide repeat protein n=1 Tax=Roseibium sp. TaxID=1936156 RepID=UPI003B52D66A
MADQDITSKAREFHGDSNEILTALSQILASSSFSNAERLKSFLEYVVTESVHGRADAIKGKTIALDVYGRGVETEGGPENVVRVDARRLRRRLDDYYETDGQAASIRIHIDSGGYAPRFEVLEVSDTETETPKSTSIVDQRNSVRRFPSIYLLLVGLTAVFAIIFFAGYRVLFPLSEEVAELPESRAPERQALLEKSPVSLQAVNMAEQARTLMVPITDLKRQKLALGFFEHAQELDPKYFGGYAGAAQIFGTLALFSLDENERQALSAKAMELARQAIQLNPTAAWAQSSASWAHYVSGNFEEALRMSARAFELDRNDPAITAVYAVIAMTSGDFKFARDLSDPSSTTIKVDPKTGTRNTYAMTNYFLGNYAEVLSSYQTAAELGEPISPLNMAFEIAAFHALGQTAEAQRKLKALTKSWPNIPLDKILRRGFKDPQHLDDVFDRLIDLGWSPPQSP